MAATPHKVLSFSRKEAANSLRGHVGRLRRILHERSAPKAALHHLLGIEQAAAILARDPSTEPVGDPEGEAARSNRDSSLFQENGRYLNDQGRALLFSLFDSGHSVRAAAASIGISVKSAAVHRAAWLRRPSSPDNAENL